MSRQEPRIREDGSGSGRVGIGDALPRKNLSRQGSCPAVLEMLADERVPSEQA